MAATVLRRARPLPAEHAPRDPVPRLVVALVFASACMAAGITWDISWHSTIGRDSFWTPAHLLEYLGGLIAGLSCGWVVLRTTFAGTAGERDRAVRFWGFYGPLGGWVAIWGAFTMLTSAPFDDWWHDAYGLDVEILSPPHTVLALGITAIQLAAVLLALAWQNRATGREARRARALFVFALGIMLLNQAIVITEHSFLIFQHSSRFYRSVAIVFPVFLVAGARASRLRWPATTVAAIYSLARLAAIWILPLFPATPKLGPIYQQVTHMVPPDFPLLVIVPAVAIDLILRHTPERRSDWINAVVLGIVFLGVFLAVQWPFAEFLQRGPTQNWFFATDNYPYFIPDESSMVRRVFVDWDGGRAALLRGLGIAGLAAIASVRLGLAWGSWMRRVWR